MPRFKLRSVMLMIAIVAAWVATGRVESNLGIELRTAFWFFLFAYAVLATVHSSGRQKAFWLGAVFALTMRFVPRGWILYRYSPRMNFANEVGNYFRDFAPDELSSAIKFTVSDTVSLIYTVVLAIVCGMLSVAIYDRSRKKN